MSRNLQSEIGQKLRVLPPEEQRLVLDFARALAVSKIQGVPGKQLLRFAGTIPSEDLQRMKAAIEEGSLDENVEMVRKAGERLVARYGGLRELVRHLQAMDRQRLRRQKRKPERKTHLQKSRI